MSKSSNEKIMSLGQNNYVFTAWSCSKLSNYSDTLPQSPGPASASVLRSLTTVLPTTILSLILSEYNGGHYSFSGGCLDRNYYWQNEITTRSYCYNFFKLYVLVYYKKLYSVFWVEERASSLGVGESQFIGCRREPVHWVQERVSVLGG